MKMAAKIAVARERAVRAPRAPNTVPDAPAALPAARLTNYVFAHSKYSSVLGQNDVLNDLLSGADAEEAGAAAAAAAAGSNGPAVNGQPPGNRAPGNRSSEARVAP